MQDEITGSQNQALDSAARSRFVSVADPAADSHINGEYFKQHPTWHVEYSPWKARNVLQCLHRKNLHPRTICEVGCGAGEVLRQLQLQMNPGCAFWGYDVAPAAIELARTRQNASLHFDVADFGQIDTPRFDALLILEVVDHVEDYLGFARSLRHRAEWKIFSFSLDISVQSALRSGSFSQRRREHSHLHHFNKEVALGALKHVGYEIVDYFYPPSLPMSTLAKLAKPVRGAFMRLSPDLAVRLFGGYSLTVLAR